MKRNPKPNNLSCLVT